MSYYSDLILATAGVQSYWRLGETSGNALDSKGAVTGTVTSVTRPATGALSGDSDTAYSFNGSTSFVALGNSYAFAGNVPYTFEFWVKPNATYTAGTFPTIISKEKYSAPIGGMGIYITQSTGKYTFTRMTTDGTITRLASATSFTNAWTHVVCRYNGSVQAIFINGVLDSQVTNNGSQGSATVSIDFGRASGGGDPFGGLLDEVAFYNVAVPAADILQHYSAGVMTLLNLSDTDTVTATESRTAAATISGAADSGTVSGTEARTAAATTAITDTSTVSGTENHSGSSVSTGSGTPGGIPAIVGTPPAPQQFPAATTHGFSIPTATVGNMLVAVVSVKSGATVGVTSMVDDGSNLWTMRQTGYVSGSSTRVEIWTAPVTAPATLVVAYLSGAGAAASGLFYEVSGVDTANPIDVSTNGADSVSDTTWNAGTLTPTAANVMLIHGMSCNSTGTITSMTTPSGYTGDYAAGSSTLQSIAAMYRQATGGTAYGGSATMSRAATNGYAAIALAGSPATTGSALGMFLTDTPTVTSTDASSIQTDSVIVPVPVSDTATVSASETASIAGTISQADSTTATATENASVAGTINPADSNTITGTENASIAGTLNPAQTNTVTATEAVATSGTMNPADTPTVSGAETYASAGTTGTADTPTVSGTEAYASAGTTTAGDTDTVTGTEAYASAGTGSTSETDTVTAGEAAAIAGTIGTVDSVLFTAGETFDWTLVIEALTLNLSDGGTISAAETYGAVRTMGVTDTDTVTGTEAYTAARTMGVTDADTVTAAEVYAGARFGTLTQTNTITATETPGIVTGKTLLLTDADTVTATEAYVSTSTFARLGLVQRIQQPSPVRANRTKTAPPLSAARTQNAKAVAAARNHDRNPVVTARTQDSRGVAVARQEDEAPVTLDRIREASG